MIEDIDNATYQDLVNEYAEIVRRKNLYFDDPNAIEVLEGEADELRAEAQKRGRSRDTFSNDMEKAILELQGHEA